MCISPGRHSDGRVRCARAAVLAPTERGMGLGSEDLEELREFLEGKARESGPLELSADELAGVAGGTSYYCGEPCSRGETSDCSDTYVRNCC